jgi:hypothetical protein
MAGGVYDSQNFEQLYLHIALSIKRLKKSCIPQKTSRKYIILGTLGKKWPFWRFLINKCGKPPILVPFLYMLGGVGAYLIPLTPSTTIRCPGALPKLPTMVVA